MRIRLLLMATLIFSLAGCSGSDNESTTSSKQEKIPSTSEKETVLIDNEDLSPGLKGIDKDKNGVRDDIDRLIAKKYSTTSTMKKVAEQTARALQKGMEATTREEAKLAGDEIFRAGDCAYELLPHATEADMKFIENMSIEIGALIANTKERFEAYWRGEELSGGMVFNVSENPICD